MTIADHKKLCRSEILELPLYGTHCLDGLKNIQQVHFADQLTWNILKSPLRLTYPPLLMTIPQCLGCEAFMSTLALSSRCPSPAISTADGHSSYILTPTGCVSATVVRSNYSSSAHPVRFTLSSPMVCFRPRPLLRTAILFRCEFSRLIDSGAMRSHTLSYRGIML